jgi:hypothetical protein
LIIMAPKALSKLKIHLMFCQIIVICLKVDKIGSVRPIYPILRR